MNKIFIKITKNEENNRLDKVLSNINDIRKQDITREQIKKLINNGFLLKNNQVFTNNSYIVKNNDEFLLDISMYIDKTLKATNIPLDIIYEDDDLVVINKSVDLTTHPGAGNEDNTLVNALINIYGNNLSKIGGDFRPGIVHRLDKDTSGLMVVAKNDIAHINLKQQLEERKLKRTYIAFLWGVLTPKSGKIEGYMQKSKSNRLKMEMTNDENARFSLTNYKTLKTFADNSISFVEFNLDTGRTHQIRVHCSYKNCPLVGDKLYGGHARHMKSIYYNVKDFVDNFPHQALQSYKIEFYQPTTNKKLNFEIPLNKEMNDLFMQLKTLEDKK